MGLLSEERRERLLAEVRQCLASGTEVAEAVRRLHEQGASIIDSIWIMRLATGRSLAETKCLVTCHPVWEKLVRATEPLHDALEKALLEEADQDGQDQPNGPTTPVIHGLVIPPRQ